MYVFSTFWPMFKNVCSLFLLSEKHVRVIYTHFVPHWYLRKLGCKGYTYVSHLGFKRYILSTHPQSTCMFWAKMRKTIQNVQLKHYFRFHSFINLCIKESVWACFRVFRHISDLSNYRCIYFDNALLMLCNGSHLKLFYGSLVKTTLFSIGLLNTSNSETI